MCICCYFHSAPTPQLTDRNGEQLADLETFGQLLFTLHRLLGRQHGLHTQGYVRGCALVSLCGSHGYPFSISPSPSPLTPQKQKEATSISLRKK